MQLEEAIEYLKLIRKNHDLERKGYVYTEECIETVLQALENSVPKEKLEKEINPLIAQASNLYEQGVLPHAAYTVKLLKDLKQELLEGKN